MPCRSELCRWRVVSSGEPAARAAFARYGPSDSRRRTDQALIPEPPGRGLRDAESRANPHPRRYRRKPGQAVVLRHQERMPREYRRARRLRGTSSVDGARCALSKIAPRQTAIRISIVEAHPALAVTCHTPLRDEDLGPAIPVAKVIGAVAGTLAENPLRVALIDFPLLVTDAGRSIADDVRARA